MPNRNALPPLDLLVGFESAARHLSFTRGSIGTASHAPEVPGR